MFLNATPLGVAYCLIKPGLALMQRQPHRSAVQCPATSLTSAASARRQSQLLCFGCHISAADTLTLLINIKVKVKVKVKVGILYSAAYAMTGPARFTISEVAVDWQERIVLQRKLRPSNCNVRTIGPALCS